MARKRMSVLTIQKVGNWQGTIKALEEMGHKVRPEANRAMTALAEEMKAAVIDHIYSQDLNWAPLNPKTVKKKGHSEVYIDTQTYVNAISIVKNRNQVSAGIKKGQQYKGRKDRSVTVDQVAMWMEFGTRRAPARPLWQPTIEEFGGAHGMRDKIASAIYERIEKTIRRNKAAIQVTRKEVRSLRLK